jgi:hypothetical protein
MASGTAETAEPPDPAPVAPSGRRANVAAVESGYQLVRWLIPVLDAMPRRQKFQLGDRLQTAALDVLDTLVEAAYTRDRIGLLQRANLGLEKMRFWIRLAHDLELMDFRRYEHAARLIDALGRQVGGWLRAERAPMGRGRAPKTLAEDAAPPP